MKRKILGHLFAIITIIIWSSTFIISKKTLEVLSPMEVLLIRFVIASIILSVIDPKFQKPISIKEELTLIVISLLLAGYFLFENTALSLTYATNVSLIVATIPILSFIVSSILTRKNRWNKNIVIGFILAYSGVLLIVLDGGVKTSLKLQGDVLALFAAICFAFYSILLDKVDEKYHIISLTRKLFYYIVLMLLIVNIFNKINSENFLEWEGILKRNVLMSLGYLGIIASSCAFILWNQSIRWIGGVKANQYIYFVPIITAIMSAVWLGENITFYMIIGGTLIISGVYLSEKKIKNRP